ncbi:small acid-soluble spore protein H [Sporolactobacillus sp. THM7-7]|nr:small acid-soluble spore protein H [Sporolactobacillus sp. THM7-7]
MNPQRAKEITESPVMVNVTHNGERVYIQHVDENKETARVYPLGQPENEREVPVGSLNEHDTKLAEEEQQVDVGARH